jgi:hypothetical protein
LQFSVHCSGKGGAHPGAERPADFAEIAASPLSDKFHHNDGLFLSDYPIQVCALWPALRWEPRQRHLLVLVRLDLGGMAGSTASRSAEEICEIK